MPPSSSPTPTPTATPREGWRTLRMFLPYLLQSRLRVALVFILLGCAKSANIGVPLALKFIVDALEEMPRVASDGLVVVPLALLLGYGLLRASTTLFNELRDIVFARVSQLSTRRIALRVFRHLHELSLDFHLSRRTGALSRDVERGSRSIKLLLQFVVFHIVPTIFEMVAICIILLINYDYRFALITALTAISYFTFTFMITNWRNRIRREMNEHDSRAHSAAVDALINYETVKYFGNEEHEARRYNDMLRQWENASIRSQHSLALLNVGQGLIVVCGVTLLMILAARGVATGVMSIGDFVLVNAFLIQLYIPLSFLGTILREIGHALIDMRNMFGLLDINSNVRNDGARQLTVQNGTIHFKRVGFGYLPERDVLHEVDFTVAGGSTVAIVGSSGCGKSTVVRLLYRFYDVARGAILIDGHDIRGCTLQSLRTAIGIVPQDTVLFNDTIRYNIAYGCPAPDCGDEDIVHVARAAHLHDFIISLPHGYDTEVGERGLKLSGGEKQRVAIARTLLKNPAILVFDEATSALDSVSEQFVQDAIRDVSRGRTTLVIAHRLSTVVDASLILVMESGRIVESGRHDDLLKKEGIYAKLWRLQQENAERH